MSHPHFLLWVLASNANSLLLYSFNWLLPLGIIRSTCFLLRYSGSTCLPILSICITVQQGKHEKTLAIPGNGALLPFGEILQGSHIPVLHFSRQQLHIWCSCLEYVHRLFWMFHILLTQRYLLRPCLDVVGFPSIHMCWSGLGWNLVQVPLQSIPTHVDWR
jgi:hypothetical protein